LATNPDQERARILATLAADAQDTADAIREDPTVLNDAAWVASFAALWTAVSVLADAVSVIECHAERPCQDCQQRAYERTITALPS
jgi:phage portal protein BeeE